jgi:hypothetical protein
MREHRDLLRMCVDASKLILVQLLAETSLARALAPEQSRAAELGSPLRQTRSGERRQARLPWQPVGTTSRCAGQRQATTGAMAFGARLGAARLANRQGRQMPLIPRAPVRKCKGEGQFVHGPTAGGMLVMGMVALVVTPAVLPPLMVARAGFDTARW